MNSAKNRSSDSPAGQVRQKPTEVDHALPAVAILAEGKHTVLRYVDLEGIDRTLDYRELTRSDPYPIPMPVDREGYGTIEHSHQYWATGYGDWLNVNEALKRYCQIDRPKRLFDFGCATGRFLRHILLFSDLEPSGCDFAPANVDWMKQHLPETIKVILNTSEPGLPYPDHHFDVVTAFSVFTHIDADEEAWLLELRRITHPDGILYLTIHNQATWDKVIERPGSFDHMLHANSVAGNIPVTKELFCNPMPADRIVFRMSNANVYNCSVWFSNAHIEKKWTQHFHILQIANSAHTGFQSPVILRPKNSL